LLEGRSVTVRGVYVQRGHGQRDWYELVVVVGIVGDESVSMGHSVGASDCPGKQADAREDKAVRGRGVKATSPQGCFS
jgi:hypothetical protein